MLRLVLFVATSAVLALTNAPGAAKEIAGAPKELIGTFHDSSERCTSYFENGVEMDEASGHEIRPIHFFQDNGHDYYSDCAGKQCQARIVNHAVTSKGYLLTLRYTGLNGSWTSKVTVTRASQDKFTLQWGAGKPGAGKPFTVVRCSHTPFEPDQAPQ